MLNITLHLGDTTFVVEKEVLSRFLGIFQSNENLKTATSYNIKSNVQRQVFLMFLHAIKSNVFPRVTPEIWSQMVQLCEEFKCNDLRLYLIQNKQRLTSFNTRKANIRKAYTLVGDEKYFNIFQKINDTDITNTKNRTQEMDENKEKTEDIKLPQKDNIQLSEDNEYSSSYSYSSSSYSQDLQSEDDFISSSDEEMDQDSDVDFDRSSDDEMDHDDNSNTNTSSEMTLDQDQSPRQPTLNSIQRMANALQEALFGNSKNSDKKITTEHIKTENSEHFDVNASFKSKIAHLDYVLFGNKHEEDSDESYISPISSNFGTRKTEVFPIINIGVRRNPRHTFRHLPSKIYRDD